MAQREGRGQCGAVPVHHQPRSYLFTLQGLECLAYTHCALIFTSTYFFSVMSIAQSSHNLILCWFLSKLPTGRQYKHSTLFSTATLNRIPKATDAVTAKI